jgi:hypothetical protein
MHLGKIGVGGTSKSHRIDDCELPCGDRLFGVFLTCCIEGRAQGQCCLWSGRRCAGERELTNNCEVVES